MDIEEMLARLDAGTSSTGTIEVEILSNAESYAKPDDSADVDDNYIERLERRLELGRSLERLLEGIRAETVAARVVKRGRLLATAARLLSPDSEIAANYHVGRYLVQLKACGEALPFIEMAETRYNESEENKKNIPVDIISFKLMCLLKQRVYSEIEHYIIQVLKDYGGEDFKPSHPFLYNTLSIACLNQGKFDAAIDACRKGLTVLSELPAEENPPERERAGLHSIIGVAARSTGRYKEAFAAFESARESARRGGDLAGAATALSEIGITWFQIGEGERAREIFEAAAQEAEKIDRPQDADRWRATLPAKTEPTEADSANQILVWTGALLRQEPPNTAEARRLALLCIRRSKERGDWNTELEARNCLAAAYKLEGKFSQALAAVRGAVQLTTKLSDRTREIVFRTNLGKTLYEAGRIWDAEEELRAAIDLGRRARDAAEAAEIRQAISAGLKHAYEVLAVVLAQSWEGKDGQILGRRNDKLIELLQGARAGNFAGWVAADNIISERGLSELYEPLLELRASDVKIEMAALSAGAGLSSLLEEQERARRNFRTAATRSGLDINIEPPVYSVEELRQSLRPRECLIDLYGFLSHVLVTLLWSEGETESFFIAWPEEERVGFLRRWQSRVSVEGDPGQRALRLRRLHGGLPTAIEPAELPVIEAPLSLMLEELGGLFINRLADALSARETLERVIIVPDKELALIPFWALTSRLPGLKISIAPGANVYRLLRERRRETAGPRLAIGDPTGSLPYALSEIESLPGFELLASEIDEIVRSIVRANMVHFSGHGVFNEKNPYLSGVIAQGHPEKTPRAFGARVEIFNYELLSVAEVLAQIHLPDCFLVTLSACSSGLPRQHAANEFVGLPAAFLIAGAKNVVGSLWPVDDAATSVMMREFYERLLRDGSVVSTPSAALAAARERLSQMKRSEVLSLGLKPEDVPDLEFPYAGPEYTLAFQHFGVD
jgi:tetratricopeptide (TPR) repeat protein